MTPDFLFTVYLSHVTFALFTKVFPGSPIVYGMEQIPYEYMSNESMNE
jgi:hypothetical protein